MGEIRFVGTGETRGYPYLVCKKKIVGPGKHVDFLIRYARKILLILHKTMCCDPSSEQNI